MPAVILKVLSYDKDTNTCIAETNLGEKFNFDPFVGCALPLSDDDYHAGKGADIVGNTYCMTIYSVDGEHVVPRAGGLTLISERK